MVLDDDSVLEPLILAESLRRCMTSRKILVFVGPAVSKRVRFAPQSFIQHNIIPHSGSGNADTIWSKFLTSS